MQLPIIGDLPFSTSTPTAREASITPTKAILTHSRCTSPILRTTLLLLRLCHLNGLLLQLL